MNAQNFGDPALAARIAEQYSRYDFAAMHAEHVRQHEAAVANGADRDGFTWKDATTEREIQQVPQERVVSRRDVATPGRIQFLVNVSAERTPQVPESAIRAWADTVTWQIVVAKIEELKKLPRVAGQRTAPVIKIPAGRYAVTGNEGHTVFVHVDRPTEGRWAGRTFVKVQAGSELIRQSATNSRTLLAKIEDAGAKEAMLRYGREIGSCGHCGRTLTNEESRQAGIGPVCRGKLGW